MDTREVTKGYRLAQWAETIQTQKSSGQNIREWCEVNGINRQQYFYWQRKLRETAAEELGLADTERTTVPSGWALCAAEPKADAQATLTNPTVYGRLLVEVNGIKISADSTYPAEKLAELILNLTRAC